jgi:hypothetical protein
MELCPRNTAVLILIAVENSDFKRGCASVRLLVIKDGQWGINLPYGQILCSSPHSLQLWDTTHSTDRSSP